MEPWRLVSCREMNAHAHQPVALRSIALFEIGKGLLAVAAACGLLSLRHTDLHAVTDAFLWRHGIDPETHYRRLFIESVAKATKWPVRQIVGFALTYAAVRFGEGFGLWYGKHWAEWFAVISAGLYLPLEFVHLAHHQTWFSAAVIVLNVVIILYLVHLLFEQRTHRRRIPQDQVPAP
jgi:uncharacterized membrane protein (DUF2068 family)